MNLTEVLRHHAERDPAAIAVTFAGTRVSYGQLLERTRRAAGALRERGIGPGDIVGVLARNGLAWIDAMCATAHLGAIFLPFNWRLAEPEIDYIREHAGVKLVISGPGLEAGEPVIDAHPVTGDDVHRLMYTSGTTSRPKGVPTTYANLYWKCASQLVELSLSRDDRGLACAPLFHVGALDITLTNLLYAGGTTHVQERFEPEPWLEAVERERITNAWLAPAMIATLLRSGALTGRTFPSLRVLTHGGERISEATLDALEAAFPNAWIADAYGLTETVSCDTFLPRAFVRSKRGSVGLPVIHAHVRVVDDAGTPVGPDVEGEIVVAGPKLFSGYWRDPRATAAALRDGWLHTGDIGHLDEDGSLYLVDRRRDMIRSGSENIASLEVERALLEHPAVVEVAVVGRADARWGEVPVAYVVADGRTSADELEAFTRSRLAGYKTPKAFRFLDALPRNSAGKVLKQHLRAKEAGG